MRQNLLAALQGTDYVNLELDEMRFLAAALEENAKLKAHAEAMAFVLGDSNAVTAYRADFPKGES